MYLIAIYLIEAHHIVHLLLLHSLALAFFASHYQTLPALSTEAEQALESFGAILS